MRPRRKGRNAARRRGSQPIRSKHMEKTKDENVLEIYTIARDLLELVAGDSEDVRFELIRHKLKDAYAEYRG